MSSSSSRTSASRSPTSPRPTTKHERLARAARKGLTPPPRISVPEWADRFRRLAKGAGARTGRWKTSTVEVARGPMLAVTEPGVHIITAMVCTQLMKTALLENVFGYFAHLDPSPMLLLQPKEAAAEQFSKERISPMVKATPVLRDLVGSSKTRNADETLLFKSFPGGFLALAGAGSPDNLARRPIRVLMSDEVDKYPVTREGEPIAIAEERTASFDLNWLSIRACSPTVEDESRIADSYEESDQRRASLACPHCGHRQFPSFHRHVLPDEESRASWKPEKAAISCEACGCEWSEGDRLRALSTTLWHQTKAFECCGERQSPLDAYERAWRAEDPSDPAANQRAVNAVWDRWKGPRWDVHRAKCCHCGSWAVPNKHAGFQAGKLYSPWQKDKPSDIAAKWVDAQGNQDKLQVWWNTQDGNPYRPTAGRAVALDVLLARREAWEADVPFGVGFLTAGVDVQDDRIEVEIVGWGADEESWSIDYQVLDGDPDSEELWARVDAYLLRTFHRADGRPFRVQAACIDTGGHHTQKAYAFCKARLGRKVWGIKGESAQNGARSPVWPAKRPTARTKASYRPFVIGTNTAKDIIRHRLTFEKHGPGFTHVREDRDVIWYEQMLSERNTLKEEGGRRFRVWECPSHKRNEALDCRVYAYAALQGLLHFGKKLNRITATAQLPYEGPQPEIVLPVPPAVPMPEEAADAADPVPVPPAAPAPPVPRTPRAAPRASRWAF
ncbi:phage terminase large subunit family protein [Muricoccus roseus]|nr:terminase gpA endonuclease subunit [Roseomonas rosea]